MKYFSDHEVTEAMIQFGGGFVNRLGMLFRAADEDNQARLKRAFPEYWEQYRELARANLDAATLRQKQGTTS